MDLLKISIFFIVLPLSQARGKGVMPGVWDLCLCFSHWPGVPVKRYLKQFSVKLLVFNSAC